MPLPQTQIAGPEWIAQQVPQDWLTPAEFARFESRPVGKRRSEWLAGRMAAKALIQAEFGLRPQEWTVGRDGVAPAIDAGGRLTEWALSLSHSGGMGAATVSERRLEGSAGIDVQQIRPVHSGLCDRVFTREERRQIAARFGAEDSAEGMLLFWALKEAAIKARRLPWGRPLQSVGVRLDGPGHGTVFLAEEPPLAARYARLDDWWLARAVLRPQQ